MKNNLIVKAVDNMKNFALIVIIATTTTSVLAAEVSGHGIDCMQASRSAHLNNLPGVISLAGVGTDFICAFNWGHISSGWKMFGRDCYKKIEGSNEDEYSSIGLSAITDQYFKGANMKIHKDKSGKVTEVENTFESGAIVTFRDCYVDGKK